MTQTEYLQKLAELFELDPEEITREKALQDLPGWGSLTLLGILGMTDEEVGVSLAPREVLQCQTVQDLVQLVGSALDPN